MKPESLIVRHVGDIYRNANSGKGHSWTILNGALHAALANCISAHLPFEIDDFSNLYRQFKGHYWFGTDNDGNGKGGRYYSLAVECGNMSACLSFEKFSDFKPYLYLGLRLAVGGEIGWLNKPASEAISAVGERETEHEVCKRILTRNAVRWFVTGISSETVRLASYYRDDNKYGHQAGKPSKLMQLTHEQLAAASRAIRKAIKEARPKKEDTKP